MQKDDDFYPYLPPLIQRICQEIGKSETEKFLNHFSGKYLYIPAYPKQGQTLTKIMGTDTAKKIIAILPTRFIVVPLCTRYKKMLRNREVHTLWNAGNSILAIAQRMDITTVTVRRILFPKQEVGIE